jgi:hypothetical protein
MLHFDIHFDIAIDLALHSSTHNSFYTCLVSNKFSSRTYLVPKHWVVILRSTLQHSSHYRDTAQYCIRHQALPDATTSLALVKLVAASCRGSCRPKFAYRCDTQTSVLTFSSPPASIRLHSTVKARIRRVSVKVCL